MAFVTEIIQAITAWVTGFIGAVVDSVSGITALFWDTTLNSGAGGLTLVGVLAVMGLGIGLVTLGIAFVRRLIAR